MWYSEFKPHFNLVVSVLIVVLTSVGLVYGADILVKRTAKIVREKDVSERENFCCTRCIWDRPGGIDNFKIGSYKKRNRHIFVGNIVSSKLFNILAVFGITSVFEAINVNPEVV